MSMPSSGEGSVDLTYFNHARDHFKLGSAVNFAERVVWSIENDQLRLVTHRLSQVVLIKSPVRGIVFASHALGRFQRDITRHTTAESDGTEINVEERLEQNHLSN